MFEAQILNNNSAAFSPWMPRGGDNITFTFEIIDKLLSQDFQVQLFEKNSEETGDGTAVGSEPLGSQSIGLHAATKTGMKELVRYKYSFKGAVPGDWVLFRILPPVWFDDVKA
ncbi:MAG: hypothetical protein V3W41_16105 [Planctomycetota bacterium]